MTPEATFNDQSIFTQSAGLPLVEQDPMGMGANPAKEAAFSDPLERMLDESIIRWSELAPQTDSRVVIAKGEKVLLDQDTLNLGGVIVEGELIFSEDFTDTNGNGELDFTADWLLVRNGGRLEIGTESNPYEADTTITLDGVDEDVMGMGMGGRFIIASGTANDGTESTISMHGIDGEKVDWTQLSAHADKGDKVITLAETVDWEVGDEIVIAPSGFDANEAEKLTVVAVNGNKVTLDKALKYDHFGETEMVDGKLLDMRAEVGLLSRNIDIQGAKDSLESEFGAHMMFMDGSSVQLSGIEIQRGGQVGKKARYPVHWHLGGDHGGDYIKNSSIHDSFQRGIVVHSVENVNVESNVTYNVFSHAYVFSEDGDEVGNTFTNNLAVLTKSRPEDQFSFQSGIRDNPSKQGEQRASGFWGRNYHNPMVGNHSAGTLDGIGFFFDTVFSTTKLGRSLRSVNDPVVFADNLAHSNSGDSLKGKRLYPLLTRGLGLMVNRYKAKINSDVVFQDFTTYKNDTSGVWIENENHVLKNAVIADSGSGVVVASSKIENVAINQDSTNNLGGEFGKDRPLPKARGFAAFSGGINVIMPRIQSVSPTIKDVTFMNLDNAVGIQQHVKFKPDATIGGTKLVNVGSSLRWDRHSTNPSFDPGVLVDLDGLLNGTGKRTRISGARFSRGR